MTKAKNILQAEYKFSDEPLDLTDIDGIGEAIERVADTKEPELLECEEKIPDYRIRWNESTETVRIYALVAAAGYEAPKRLYEDGHPENLVAGDPA